MMDMRRSSTVIDWPGLSPTLLGRSWQQRTLAVTRVVGSYLNACMSSRHRRSVISFVTEAGRATASACRSKRTSPVWASTAIAPT